MLCLLKPHEGHSSWITVIATGWERSFFFAVRIRADKVFHGRLPQFGRLIYARTFEFEMLSGLISLEARSLITGLICDRLQFRAQRLFPLTQRGHSLTQLLERQEFLLIGGEQPFQAVADTRQFPAQTLFALFGRIGGTRRHQPSVEFLLDQRGVLKQSNTPPPHDLIEEILAHQAGIVAHRTAQFSPTFRANTFVIVDLARAGVGRGAGKSITTLLTADQALHDARRDGAASRSYSVFLEQFLGSREAVLTHQCGHRDLDPLLARTFVADTVAGYNCTAPPQCSRDTHAPGAARLAESSSAAIGRIAQHGPHHRALPTGALLAGCDAFGIKPARDLSHAEPVNHVHLVNPLNHPSLSVDHSI